MLFKSSVENHMRLFFLNNYRLDVFTTCVKKIKVYPIRD